MTLRPATAADCAELAALHAAAFPPAQAWGPAAIGLMLGLPGAFGMVAESQGFVLARVAADEAELLTLAVHPAARRRGLGAALLGAALDAAAAGGAVGLFLEVAAGNAAARTLYRAVGASEVGRRRHYYADGDDAVVMRVDLSLYATRGA